MATHGKNSEFALDTTAGDLTDLSEYISEVSLPLSTDMSEVTGFQKGSKEYVPGLKDCQFTASVVWNATVDGYLWTIYNAGTIATFNYKPDGTIVYSGEVYISNYTPASSTNDAVKGSVTFQVSGDVGRA
jgi:FlaG/FlaF family flagellin (archaellin)